MSTQATRNTGIFSTGIFLYRHVFYRFIVYAGGFWPFLERSVETDRKWVGWRDMSGIDRKSVV